MTIIDVMRKNNTWIIAVIIVIIAFFVGMGLGIAGLLESSESGKWSSFAGMMWMLVMVIAVSLGLVYSYMSCRSYGDSSMGMSSSVQYPMSAPDAPLSQEASKSGAIPTPLVYNP
jgi:hypothetical protein